MTARRIFLALVIAATIAGVVNTYGDHSAVERMAKGVACGGHDGAACKARLKSIARTPFYQEYQFTDGHKPIDGDAERAPDPPRDGLGRAKLALHAITVRCTRSFYLVGDYACALLPLP
jgi:hypothetical protein